MKYKLRKYVDLLEQNGILSAISIEKNLYEVPIDCVSYDSRKISANSIFICKGANFSSKFAFQAADKGAICYISTEQIDGLKNYIIVTDIRKAICLCADIFYEFAPSKVKTIGITGTKGKGCTAYILKSIVNKYLEANKKNRCAFLGTVDTYDGVVCEKSKLTTPEILELHKHFYNAYKSKLPYMIMEVSSIGLKQNRTYGVNYEVASFLNLGKDHISDIEHPNLEDYFYSKLKIFDTAKKACINADSKKFDEIYKYANERCKVITYGIKNQADIVACDIETHTNYSTFTIKTCEWTEKVRLNVAGLFNVSNALCAIANAIVLGIDKKYIIAGLLEAEIPGRMKYYISNDKKLVILVDYAHNGISFEAIFSSLKATFPNYDISAVFGSVGNKAYDRRIDMPRVASKYCKNIVVTEDDTGNDCFEDIATEIAKNISIENYEIIKDREQALKYAISCLDKTKNNVIAFIGKGDDDTQKVGFGAEKCVPDTAIAQKYINIYNKKQE